MVTIVLQVGLYSFNLVTREDYKENVNTMEMADEEDVICYRTVEFITEKEEIIFDSPFNQMYFHHFEAFLIEFLKKTYPNNFTLNT